jgi:hypothetical protein
MVVALKQSIPSLTLGTSSVKFVNDLEAWEQELEWIELGSTFSKV